MIFCLFNPHFLFYEVTSVPRCALPCNCRTMLEMLFKLTKVRNNGAQAITFNEYLPALMGRDLNASLFVPSSKVRRTSIEFATAAFRFGHSQVGNHIARLGPNFTDTAGGPLRLKQTYFNPKIVSEQESTIDVFLRGAGVLSEADLTWSPPTCRLWYQTTYVPANPYVW